MELFQHSVLDKYLKDLNQQQIESAYSKFTDYFHNPVIQENIRDAKEEQFQEGFLRELFVKVLGYTINPNPDYNLTTEFKNEKGAQKADGAILNPDKESGEKALGVIELKGTDTKDLDKINSQAFSYKNNQSDCIYIITSNFEKLRFFIHNAVNKIDFNLFTLTIEEFKLLWICLSAESILNGLPLKIKEESLLKEENVTKNLYKDYATFRMELWQNMVKNNQQQEQLLLFKKTQKLLDRFLFIFFAEDSGLLPPNSISRIVKRWNILQDEDAYKPLYDIFKQYFGYINTGRKGKKDVDDVFAYNGGLFQSDELLDSIVIEDEVLFKHVNQLTNYDFQTEVDVNILGHIFENSLTEIENITAKLEGQEIDKSKTKRKKDGVFYTPKYITKYIVDNTVGKLCEEKKIELGIIDEEYAKGRRNRKKDTIKKLDVSLKNYRNWLLNITICDPACGSGAFLNQALEFLINEHAYIDELHAQLFAASLVFQDVSNHILENNLFGVDINEESVEIAKLSLWLRTAQKGRKLTFLNKNIKCGNSLIDDPEVAGEKAFNWQKEFPEIFKNGGFDVVIGNPPYVDLKGLNNTLVKELFKKFQTTENRINLYSIFIEKGYWIIKPSGFLSFINPNSILMNSSYTKIRRLLIDDVTTIVKLPDGVFEDAKVETIIFEFRKEANCKNASVVIYPKDKKILSVDNYGAKTLIKNNWKLNDSFNYNIYVSSEQLNLLKKVKKDSVPLIEIADFTLGITPYDKYKGHSSALIKSRGYHSITKKDESYQPLITGKNVIRFFISNEVSEYIKYGEWLGAPREERFFKEPRIIVRQIVSGNPQRIYAGYTDKPLYYTQIGFGLIPKSNNIISVKTLLAIINSKLINFFHKYSFLDLEKKLFQKILIANCKKLPIKKTVIDKPNFLDNLTDKMIIQNQELFQVENSFLSLLVSKFEIEKLPTKLQSWHELEFKDFLKELKKAKIQLTLSEETEWMQYFNEQKQKVQELKTEINRVDAEIDQMVYELYGLSEEEIKIVENS